MKSDIEYQREYNNRIEREVECPMCGKIFRTYYKHQKNCSPECRKQYRRDWALQYHYDDLKRAKEKRKIAWEKNKEKEYLKHREWVARNPDKIKGYQEKDKEASRARWKEWAQTVRGKLIKKAIKYRRKQKEFPEIPKNVSNERLCLFNGCCFCKSDGALTVEHLVPLAKGGKNEEHNLFGSCMKCNNSKGIKDWKAWFRKQSFYDLAREHSIQLACNQ